MIQKNIKFKSGFAIPAIIIAIAIILIGGGIYTMSNRMVKNTTNIDTTPNPATNNPVTPANPANISTGTSTSTSKIPKISLISPTGGETWKIGSNQTISFSVSGATGPSKANWEVGIFIGDSLMTTLQQATFNTGKYTFKIPKSYLDGDINTTLHPGKYKVTVGLYDGPVDVGNKPLSLVYQSGKIVSEDTSRGLVNITN